MGILSRETALNAEMKSKWKAIHLFVFNSAIWYKENGTNGTAANGAFPDGVDSRGRFVRQQGQHSRYFSVCPSATKEKRYITFW